jgi:hypothetical protein
MTVPVPTMPTMPTAPTRGIPLPRTAAPWGRALLYTAFTGWFLATALSQDPTRKHSGFRKYDPTGIFIADWRFFAPVPGTHDHHLLYRDVLPDGSTTDWREIEQMRTRKPLQILFFPTRRGDKAITDAVGSLLWNLNKMEKGPEFKNAIQLSMPYLALLNFVTHQQPHAPGAETTEYIIARTNGFDESVDPEVVFLSNRHALR